jgi:hypothetical protein
VWTKPSVFATMSGARGRYKIPLPSFQRIVAAF